MPGTESTELQLAGMIAWLCSNGEVFTLLAKLLSNQHAFFATVSKDWKNAWDDLPTTTQAITPDTSISQLKWCFDGGLKKKPIVCERIAEQLRN